MIRKADLYVCKSLNLKTLKKILVQSVMYQYTNNTHIVDPMTVNLLKGVGMLKTLKYSVHTQTYEFIMGVVQTARFNHACIRVTTTNSSHHYADVILSSSSKYSSGFIREGLNPKDRHIRQYWVSSLNSNNKFTPKPHLTEDHYHQSQLILKSATYEAICNGKLKLWVQGETVPTDLPLENPFANEYVQNISRAGGLSLHHLTQQILSDHEMVIQSYLQNKKKLVETYNMGLSLDILNS